MYTTDIRSCRLITKCGRYDTAREGVILHWSSSYIHLNAKGTYMDIEIECSYTTMKPYISFIVNGMKAQTLCPLRGTHVYSIFMGFTPDKVHDVRVIKETQPFFGDERAYVRLTKLYHDGEITEPAPASERILFVGDSYTSGEGAHGPVAFDEWVPMLFCASNDYAYLTAQKLNADYQVISQSGWGIVGSWDNNPNCNIPSIYDRMYLYGGEYDFSFKPDHIVIALGLNDQNALNQPAWTDPETGKVNKFGNSEEKLKNYKDSCVSFLAHVHEKDPQAAITWMDFSPDEYVSAMVRQALTELAEHGINVRYAPIMQGVERQPDFEGARYHPGKPYHECVSERLAALLASEKKQED